MIEILTTLWQMTLIIFVSTAIILVIVPPVKRAIDKIEQLPQRK